MNDMLNERVFVMLLQGGEFVNRARQKRGPALLLEVLIMMPSPGMHDCQGRVDEAIAVPHNRVRARRFRACVLPIDGVCFPTALRASASRMAYRLDAVQTYSS